jgi:hypothetical protein
MQVCELTEMSYDKSVVDFKVTIGQCIRCIQKVCTELPIDHPITGPFSVTQGKRGGGPKPIAPLALPYLFAISRPL